jgi:hypothetical protein
MEDFSALDILIRMRVNYHGDAKLSVHSALIANLGPIPGFASLSVTLSASGIVIEGLLQCQHHNLTDRFDLRNCYNPVP